MEVNQTFTCGVKNIPAQNNRIEMIKARVSEEKILKHQKEMIKLINKKIDWMYGKSNHRN